MMKAKTMAGVGIAACAAACAASVGIPALLGTGVIGAGGAFAMSQGKLEALVLGSLAAIAVTYLLWTWRQKKQRAAQACAADASCGCREQHAARQ